MATFQDDNDGVGSAIWEQGQLMAKNIKPLLSWSYSRLPLPLPPLPQLSEPHSISKSSSNLFIFSSLISSQFVINQQSPSLSILGSSESLLPLLSDSSESSVLLWSLRAYDMECNGWFWDDEGYYSLFSSEWEWIPYVWCTYVSPSCIRMKEGGMRGWYSSLKHKLGRNNSQAAEILMRSKRQVESFMVSCVGRYCVASGVDFTCLRLIFMRMVFTWSGYRELTPSAWVRICHLESWGGWSWGRCSRIHSAERDRWCQEFSWAVIVVILTPVEW